MKSGLPIYKSGVPIWLRNELRRFRRVLISFFKFYVPFGRAVTPLATADAAHYVREIPPRPPNVLERLSWEDSTTIFLRGYRLAGEVMFFEHRGTEFLCLHHVKPQTLNNRLNKAPFAPSIKDRARGENRNRDSRFAAQLRRFRRSLGGSFRRSNVLYRYY